jgi:hypothetical protein
MAFEADGLFPQDMQNLIHLLGTRNRPDANLLGFVDVNQDLEIRAGQSQDVETLHLAADLSLLYVHHLGDAARRIDGLLADSKRECHGDPPWKNRVGVSTVSA